jgi:hypothetical protein
MPLLVAVQRFAVMPVFGFHSISNSELHPCNSELVGCGETRLALPPENASHFERDIHVAHSNSRQN